MKILTRLLLTFVMAGICFTSSAGQDNVNTQLPPVGNKLEKQEAEDRAYSLLDQVIAGIGSLKTPENRSRLEMMAADLLWKRDTERARSLFLQAAADVGELARHSAGKHKEPFGRYQSSVELRQELILTAARHDAVLAYELFRRTQPNKVELTEAGRAQHETYIEQLLLAEVSQIDPKFALSKAEEMLDRGAYSLAITATLAQIQKRDERAATQLTEKLLGSLRADVLLNSYEAINVTLELLRAGPRASEAPTGSIVQLSVSAYRRLLDTAAMAVLKPSPNTVQRQNAPAPMLDQQNATDLLLNLRPLLPQIEQHLPERYQAIRQKMNELKNAHSGFDSLTYLTLHGASNNLLTAASTPPPAIQLAQRTNSVNAEHSEQQLTDAYVLVAGRATDYEQLKHKLQVIRALRASDPARTVELLQSGIAQLNELTSAAATLNGFDVEMFVSNEMPLPGNSQLGGMVVQYGQELALFAQSDFPRAVATAEQFQYPEASLFARLSIVACVMRSGSQRDMAYNSDAQSFLPQLKSHQQRSP